MAVNKEIIATGKGAYMFKENDTYRFGPTLYTHNLKIILSWKLHCY